MLSVTVFIYLKPQKFIDLWLTRDQQGQILFNFAHYEKASAIFNDTRWQAYSLYGAEKFEQSATLYNQYSLPDDILSRANALAHDRRYVKARDLYQSILDNDGNNKGALNNIKIVQEIIDEVNLMSESQKTEDGDSVKELGDEPKTGDGAEKKEARKQKVDQLSAEQLLLDPKLNEMWLRQVQKDPARFLAQKFYMQNERKEKIPPVNKVKQNNSKKDSENDSKNK
ncbi:MAG: tetratricopeptide repeat protein [Colwellia sp.]